MTRLLTFLLVFCVAACTRPQTTGFSAPHPEAKTETVFVATMRNPGQHGQMFGQTRATEMSFAKTRISVPPTHKIGHIERTTGPADAKRHFAPLSADILPSVQTLSRNITSAQTNAQEPLLLFVHGYNNTLEDAVFRLAQIQHDFELTNPSLLFSWPSAGDPRGYIYDRDSVLFARSDFAHLISDLEHSGQRRIMILAHSMGGNLVMEALRQLAIEGNSKAMSAIESVVLMAPDIDTGLFQRQAQEIGKLPEPFVIMTTQKDQVLNISGLLSGRKARLGRIENADIIGDLGVFVLDFSLFDTDDNFGHMVPVSTPEAITFLRRLSLGLTNAPNAFSRYVLLGDDRRKPN
ncbi:alpha/beta fold hydrolase [Lentibacter algarum]|uniref:alpha/beta hydrolase n=1 Tax=Lentibacter algarum TaxID=576131 RepID=UPI001C07C7EA|nr:alpha/beta fold hydrolase [Lentibacter algarum]MBU2980809.1 alpha/beta fold hydrolase [Lentibacter algarum]